MTAVSGDMRGLGLGLSSGAEEPSSRPSTSQSKGSSRPPTGGSSNPLVAAPPAHPPNRGGAPAVRRNLETVSSPRSTAPQSFSNTIRSENMEITNNSLDETNGDVRDHKAVDTLGPRLVDAANEFATILNNASSSWSQLHSLMRASVKERNELLQNVARQEAEIAGLRAEKAKLVADHEEEIKELNRKAQQEQEEALTAARASFDEEKAKALEVAANEAEKTKADALAEAQEDADRDKMMALAAAKEAGEQELMEALAVARQRAEEDKLEALSALRQRAQQEKREALAEAAQQAELDKQAAVAVALERADQLRERVVQEERERASTDRKKAVASERDRLQAEKYRALAEERERAKMALARAEAIEQEKKRQEAEKAALEAAASLEKAVCANCQMEFVIQENGPGACKCVHNGATAQVHVEGLLWHPGAELTNWVKMRRRWACCPQNEIMGTYADLCKVGHKAHDPLPDTVQKAYP